MSAPSPSPQPPQSTKPELSVEVEEVSSIVRRLKVVVPERRVTYEMDKALRDVRKRTRIKGFRPGKAPMKLIEQRYGGELRDEVLERVINDAFREAIAEESLEPVAPGVIEEKTWEPGKDLDFTARVELQPEVEVANYKGLEVDKPAVRVSNADVDEQIDHAREQHAELVPVGDREVVEEGDIVVANLTPTDGEGEPREGVEIDLQRSSDKFREQLVGARVGDTRHVDVTPAHEHDHDDEHDHDHEHQGPTAYEVEVVELKQRELPEADDDFAKDLGYDSMLSLRGEVREKLSEQRTKSADESAHHNLLVKLLEAHPFEVPQAIVERQATAMAQDLGERMQRAGVSTDVAQQEIEKNWDRLWRDATFLVKRAYVLRAIADKEGIEVTQQDLDAHYERMSEASGLPVERVRATYAHREQLDSLRRRLREDKTLEILLSEAKINEVEPDTEGV